MSYMVVQEGEWPHVCAMEGWTDHPTGTYLQCECGQVWRRDGIKGDGELYPLLPRNPYIRRRYEVQLP